MKAIQKMLTGAMLALVAATAFADAYDTALKNFHDAGQSAGFFSNSYAYALFPTVGKAGLVVGGAFGDGKVYVGGKYVGDATLTKLSVGFQAGGQAYSQIIFFQNKQAFDKFADHEFEFSAGASAVLITAGATAEAGTTGASASASVTKKDATTTGKYENGMVVFNIVKGGAMYEASLGGQHYKYKPLK
ncbi:MAG TPA: lipid-binding SYLF domain-containing protein [Steroidobacteraceae bacterium]|nr:lipid-binding SYLF domain-containing protein [Steroidobacteraceae bacterium]